MRRIGMAACASLLAVLPCRRAAAQDHDHARPGASGVGTVHFATSCRPAVAPRFDRFASNGHPA